ncbi:hypothetical protein SAMN05660772_02809 [Pasteurella testudinis DSM 23072]|uniref:Uncharacterized protein n=1 Tax=Pasteurella testudinis DSM 23072 TaxID=1122938 RepID=A0A1W1V402_9PAST|nr:hypothetical protein SAMN05660772_02809 [Pasteurella testudinis DSM 23072]SUB51614.1 Uncharacterised protein [Pasteurella testudinis]
MRFTEFMWLDHKKEMKILELAEEWVKQEDD